MAAEPNRAARVRSLARSRARCRHPEMPSGPVTIDWKFVPSFQLAGDMFGYHWLDPQHLAIYLLDVSGHGVSSALLGGFRDGERALAQRYARRRSARPRRGGRRGSTTCSRWSARTRKYFTIWYGVFDTASTLRWRIATRATRRRFCVPARRSCHQLEADAPAVGMMPEMPYDTKTIAVAKSSRLIVFSDGIFEVEQADGEMWPSSRTSSPTSGANSPRDDLISRHIEYTRQLGGRDTYSDDFSMSGYAALNAYSGRRL